MYHAKANINYYDLVTVQVRNIFNSVPAPLFEEWTGIHPEDIPGVEVISRDYLEKIISKERTIRETEEFWSSNISFDSQVGQIIRDLTNGDSLVLDTIINQFDEEIISKELYINDGLFEVWEINCMNSSDLGLGTCRCMSHSSSETYWVSPETALELIKIYVEKQEEIKEKKRTRKKNYCYVACTSYK